MSRFKRRKLNYRRANWFEARSNTKTLETLLKEAAAVRSAVADTKIDIGGSVCEIRNRRVTKQSIYLHIAQYTPNERTAIVPHEKIVSVAADSNLDTTPPPKETDFLNGHSMLRVQDNHIIICSSDLSEARTYSIFVDFFGWAVIRTKMLI
jgi:hypothetical protein